MAHERYEARKQIKEQIDSLPVAQRRTAALEIYLAFYWSGANLLPAVCKKEGVDLSVCALRKGLLRAANLSQGDSTVDVCRAVLAKQNKVLDKMNFPEAFPYVWSVAAVP